MFGLSRLFYIQSNFLTEGEIIGPRNIKSIEGAYSQLSIEFGPYYNREWKGLEHWLSGLRTIKTGTV